MTDHVVEEIDMLYWDAGALDVEAEAEAAMEAGEDSNILYVGDDLTLDKYTIPPLTLHPATNLTLPRNISKLPSTWDTSADPPSNSTNDEDTPIDQDDYITALTHLQSLSAQRLTLQQKLNTYRTLLTLLEPYRKPKENIQPNLIGVGRDVPLAAELTKVRTLAIRVAGRIGEKYGDVQVPASAEDEDVDMEQDGKKKLDGILASW